MGEVIGSTVRFSLIIVGTLIAAEGASTTAPRWMEHPGTTDRAIIRMRGRLIEGARDLQESIEPYAASHPESFRVRSGQAIARRRLYFTEDPATWASITGPNALQTAKS